MAYIKHADITTQEIMDSHLGGAVLGYEIGKIPAHMMRKIFSEEQLQMLQFIRRDEAPKRWDAVLQATQPAWRTHTHEGLWGVAAHREFRRDSAVRTTGMYIACYGIELREVLEHLLMVIQPNGKQLSPTQRIIIALNGGAVAKAWNLEAEADGIEMPPINASSNIEPIKGLTLLAFPTEGGRCHCAWMLTVLTGAHVGKVETLGAAAVVED